MTKKHQLNLELKRNVKLRQEVLLLEQKILAMKMLIPYALRVASFFPPPFSIFPLILTRLNSTKDVT